MTKECLELIYSEIKEKSPATHEHVEGFKKNQVRKDQDKYLKVISWLDVIYMYLYSLVTCTVEVGSYHHVL